MITGSDLPENICLDLLPSAFAIFSGCPLTFQENTEKHGEKTFALRGKKISLHQLTRKW
jgi:hypothetical protein